MLFGIAAGLVSALLQSISYLCSAGFMLKYRSPLRLVIFSQLVMGAFCLPFVPFVFPRGLQDRLPEFAMWVCVWLVVFSIGQVAFFSALRSIESSRISSLLGLKILVLSAISILVLRTELAALQWIAILLATAAAVGMNWSGGARFSPAGIAWLFLALIFYSLTDMTETRLVTMPHEGSLAFHSFSVGCVCYAALGIATLPFLLKFRWTNRQFLHAAPFAGVWYFSQVALFVCFGLLGTVFGNVIQASRGMISIALGVLLFRFGLGKFDAKIGPGMWLRRAVASVLMALGIILYSLAQWRA